MKPSQHVHQLLRTLNLNSPGPLAPEGPSKEMGPLSTSPNVSTVSTTSALLTPPQVSPVECFGERKLNPTYEFGPGYQPQSNSTLLFETDS